MKIVHVSGGAHVHGIQQYVLTVAGGQRARGDDVLVIADQPGEFFDACKEYDIPVIIEEYLEREPPEPPAQRVEERLASTFNGFGAEVVHCHTRRAALKSISVGNRLGIPCVYTHHVAPVEGLLAARQAGLKFATISLARADYDKLQQIGLPKNEVYYVPNGTKIMSRGGRQSDHADLLFVGRLEHVKGIDIAILVMAEMRRRHGAECPVLNVYGDGTLEGYAREMVSVLCLDDIVRFHGTRMGILEDCAGTDILVMPSRSEAGPLVVLEAMSRGMAIAASDVGEVAEMIPDQQYGRISPVESIIGLADAIDSLLSDVNAGKFDPDLLIARHREVYSEDKMVENIDGVYGQLGPGATREP
jgi:glycosyltransferase involved in cell wall biosynthesis